MFINKIEASEGLQDEKFMDMIYALYSNLPIITDIKITINGNPDDISKFLEYVGSHPKYFESIGCETPEFIISPDNYEYIITSDDIEEQLNDIMVHYV